MAAPALAAAFIPHAVHDDLTCTIALFAVLETPVDFDAIDGQPVDIICLVVGPTNDETNNLKCIASVTRSHNERLCRSSAPSNHQKQCCGAYNPLEALLLDLADSHIVF